MFSESRFPVSAYFPNSYLTDDRDSEEADGVHVEGDGDTVEGHRRVRHGGEGAGTRKVRRHVAATLGTLLGAVL